MQIAMSATREQFPLSPKKIVKKTLSSGIGWSIFLSFFWVVLILVLGSTNATSQGTFGSLDWLGPATLALLGFLFFLILWSYIYQRWYFAVYFYEFTPDFVQIKKGPITPHEITLPYERIQDVYVDQDILDRMFGLYDVHLSTATISSGMEAHIDGVEKQAAEGLRDILLQTVQQRISKNRGANAPTNNIMPMGV